MKNSRFLSGLVLGLFLLGTAMPSPVLAAFSNADLAGTWHFFDFFDDPSGNDPGWTRGTLTMNSSGTVTSGSFVDSDGFSSTVTAGSLSLNSSGVLSGSIAAGGITHTISQGQMDAAKTLALFVGSDSQGFRFTGSAIKAGGSFSTANLAGTWHFTDFFDHPSGNDPNWARGTLTMNSSGTVTSGSLVDSNGFSITVTAGSLSLNSSGVLSGSLTLSVGVNVTISQGKMDAAKTTALFVGIDSQGSRFTGSAIKTGGTFSTANLAGTWRFTDFFDHPSFNDPGWSAGVVTINSSGTVTGGSLVDSDGFISTVTGGSLSLNSSGVLSGSIIAGGINHTISQGKMDAAKTTALFVGTDSEGYRFTGSAIKTGLQAITDFDADGKTDIAVYQTTTGNWFWVGSTSGFDSHLAFGGSGFLPVQADYDGDGFVDTAVYDTTNGNWFISQTMDGFTVHPSFGGPGYIPVPGDYDGDGKVDIAVYETSSGNWFYVGSTSGFGYHLAFGGSNFIPVPADYDGDGVTDTAVHDTTNGNWFIDQTTDGFTVHPSFGGAGFLSLPGDYDGDGKSDIAVYETSSGNWFYVGSASGFGSHIAFGGANFTPVPGDYDGDGKTDTAVYDTTNGNWFIDQTTAGFTVHPSFGGVGYVPVLPQVTILRAMGLL